METQRWLRELFHNKAELTLNLTQRELRTKYRRSFLGWGWSLLNPVATVALYTFVFGTLFGSEPPTGNPSGVDQFALYLLCGVIPWNYFSTVTNMSTGSILGNAGLVRKVAFPRQSLVVSQALFMLVQLSIETAVVAVVLLIAGSPLLLGLPQLVIVMCLLGIFATGIGLVLGPTTIYFRDLPYLWTIVIQVWFFATPIVYAFENVRDDIPVIPRVLIEHNPMTEFVSAFRVILFDGRIVSLSSFVELVLYASSSLACGILVFRRLNPRLAEEA